MITQTTISQYRAYVPVIIYVEIEIGFSVKHLITLIIVLTAKTMNKSIFINFCSLIRFDFVISSISSAVLPSFSLFILNRFFLFYNKPIVSRFQTHKSFGNTNALFERIHSIANIKTIANPKQDIILSTGTGGAL
jgi:hypothetical protein